MDSNATEVYSFIQTYHLADYASVIGFIITVIGFLVTILNLIKTRKASEAATMAVNNIRNDFKKIDTVANLSSVLIEMEEIKKLHRKKEDSGQLPEKYAKLRASLISIRTNNQILLEDDNRILQGAITQLSAFERALDNNLDKDNITTFSIAKFNSAISTHIDSLQEVLMRVKFTVGENSHELPKNS